MANLVTLCMANLVRRKSRACVDNLFDSLSKEQEVGRTIRILEAYENKTADVKTG